MLHFFQKVLKTEIKLYLFISHAIQASTQPIVILSCYEIFLIISLFVFSFVGFFVKFSSLFVSLFLSLLDCFFVSKKTLCYHFFLSSLSFSFFSLHHFHSSKHTHFVMSRFRDKIKILFFKNKILKHFVTTSIFLCLYSNDFSSRFSFSRSKSNFTVTLA